MIHHLRSVSRLSWLPVILASVLVASLTFAGLRLFSENFREKPAAAHSVSDIEAELAALQRQASERGAQRGPAAVQQRVNRMEAQLQAMAEAARREKRPTSAQIHRELEQMLEARRTTETSFRTGALARWGAGLSISLALVALGFIMGRRLATQGVESK